MIYCNFNLFDLHQQIMKIDEATNQIELVGISTLNNLGADIAAAAYKADESEITLIGEATYADTIREQIERTNSMKYNNRKLNVRIK